MQQEQKWAQAAWERSCSANKASTKRGSTSVRVPWVKKKNEGANASSIGRCVAPQAIFSQPAYGLTGPLYQALRRGFMGPAITLAEVPSTMAVVAGWAQAGAPSGSTAVAWRQTQGRGRLGRAWCSELGAGLWCTILLRPRQGRDWAELSIVAGVAVRRALCELGGHGIKLKWPNDLILRDRKLGGILLQTVPSSGTPPGLPLGSGLGFGPGPGAGAGAVLVGIGINLTTAALPQALRHQACGLLELRPLASLPWQRVHCRLLQSVRWHLHQAVKRWETAGLVALCGAWLQADFLRGQAVVAQGVHGTHGTHGTQGTQSPVFGHGAGIDRTGRLQLRQTDGSLVSVASGEVSSVRPSC